MQFHTNIPKYWSEKAACAYFKIVLPSIIRLSVYFFICLVHFNNNTLILFRMSNAISGNNEEEHIRSTYVSSKHFQDVS